MRELEEIDLALPSRMLAEPSRTITPLNPSDPARLGYPATLPLELAMRTSSTRAICEDYGITEEEWECIRHEPLFLDDLKRAVEMLKEEGMSFKVKAKLQAEEILKTSWRLIHDPTTPPNVRADLIKSTVRWAGYDVAPGSQQTTPGSGFQFNIVFSNGDQPKLVN